VDAGFGVCSRVMKCCFGSPNSSRTPSIDMRLSRKALEDITLIHLLAIYSKAVLRPDFEMISVYVGLGC